MLTWIIPSKFQAFSGPCATPTDTDGFPTCMPGFPTCMPEYDRYAPVFLNTGIGLVVRLSKQQYDKRRFLANGVNHKDPYFRVGTFPPQQRFRMLRGVPFQRRLPLHGMVADSPRPWVFIVIHPPEPCVFRGVVCRFIGPAKRPPDTSC